MNPSAVRNRKQGLELARPPGAGHRHILDEDALGFLAALAERFTPGLADLLEERKARQQRFDRGVLPGFDPATSDLRESDWCVAPIPPEVQDRRTEITGPVTRKMVINALNSGAQVYMADFEDSTSPTWNNILDGQANLLDAVRRRIDFTSPEGKDYRLAENTAVLMVRPRGLHLPERHLLRSGEPVPGALVDFGLYLWHNHAELARRGSAPYFYLPKLEHHSEAAWWESVIAWAEDRLGIERGTVRVTVLIETLPAVFQMHEILHALRGRILGLNCGRWDYIFSYIKTLRNHPDRVLPERGQVTMTAPFLRAYSRLLIQTCHRRGAFAMGGMAAQIPVREDAERNETAMQKVRADKAREAGDGHDGTWVAHPGLESLARAEFDRVMSGPNQLDRLLDDLEVSEQDLLAPCEGTITEPGVRGNVRVAIEYLSAWLEGNGCVPLDHLMEDAATAEIARAQLWQWRRHGARLEDGREVTGDWLRDLFEEERRRVLEGPETGRTPAVNLATALILEMTLGEELPAFLTLPAYAHLHD